MDALNTEQELNQPVNYVKEGIKIGLINGAIAMLLMYGSYFAGLDTFATVQFFTRLIPYMIIILIIYGFQLRKKNGNYLPFKDALQYSFMSYVIVAILMAIGTYILFNIIDNDLTKKVYDIMMVKMTNLGMKSEELEKAMGKREDQNTNLRTIALGTGTGLIWDFVISLIVAVIIRREKPVI